MKFKQQSFLSFLKPILIVSFILVVVSAVVLGMFGFNRGFDFTGGTQLVVNFANYNEDEPAGLTEEELLKEIPWTIVKTDSPVEYRFDLSEIGMEKDDFDKMVEIVTEYNNSNLDGFEIDGKTVATRKYSYALDYDESQVIGTFAQSKYVGTFEGFILLELHLTHATQDAIILYEKLGNRIVVENADNRMLLYKDKKYYTLTEAYKLNLISLDAIASIPCKQIVIIE